MSIVLGRVRQFLIEYARFYYTGGVLHLLEHLGTRDTVVYYVIGTILATGIAAAAAARGRR